MVKGSIVSEKNHMGVWLNEHLTGEPHFKSSYWIANIKTVIPTHIFCACVFTKRSHTQENCVRITVFNINNYPVDTRPKSVVHKTFMCPFAHTILQRRNCYF